MRKMGKNEEEKLEGEKRKKLKKKNKCQKIVLSIISLFTAKWKKKPKWTFSKCANTRIFARIGMKFNSNVFL